MKIKILQINTWWGGWLWDNLIEFIKKENPDVIFAQEVYNSDRSDLGPNFRTVESFLKEFKFTDHYFTPGYMHGREEGWFDQGNAIFSRFPIQEKDFAYIYGKYQKFGKAEEESLGYSAEPHVLQHARIDLDDGKFINVFNIHGIADNRGDYDSPERLKMSEITVDHIRDKKNIVLAGDFNVRPNTETIRNMEKGLVNVFKDELVSTFNMRRKDNPGYATSVVDMIFVSPELEILEHSCPDVDVSDHLPLLVTLEV